MWAFRYPSSGDYGLLVATGRCPWTGQQCPDPQNMAYPRLKYSDPGSSRRRGLYS
jgi:hypothetical protein